MNRKIMLVVLLLLFGCNRERESNVIVRAGNITVRVQELFTVGDSLINYPVFEEDCALENAIRNGIRRHIRIPDSLDDSPFTYQMLNWEIHSLIWSESGNPIGGASEITEHWSVFYEVTVSGILCTLKIVDMNPMDGR